MEEKDKAVSTKPTGPGEDCNCPVCVFAKSHAPGNPYDVKQCPKYNAQKEKKKKEKKA